MADLKNEAITSRDVDFAQWYTDVCKKAELMDYSSVKGFIIYQVSYIRNRKPWKVSKLPGLISAMFLSLIYAYLPK